MITHKPMKDRITLPFCANACGDYKTKPLLVEVHSQELTTDELLQLHEQQGKEVMGEDSSGEVVDEEQQSSSTINKMLKSLESVSAYVAKYLPEKVVAVRSTNLFNHFRNILKRRQKQISMDKFVVSRKFDPKEPSVEPEVVELVTEPEL